MDRWSSVRNGKGEIDVEEEDLDEGDRSVADECGADLR